MNTDTSTPYRISPHIEGLIFDFDGTLVDSMPVHYLSWRSAFAAFDAPFSKQFFYDNAGVSLVNVVREYNRVFGRQLPPEDVVATKDAAHRQYLPHTRPIPQVVAVAKHYHGRLPMAVATGNSRNLTDPLLEMLQLRALFDTVVYGEDVSHPKPNPDGFIEAARRIRVSHHACLVFEDGAPGIQAARAAGMDVVDVHDIIPAITMPPK